VEPLIGPWAALPAFVLLLAIVGVYTFFAHRAAETRECDRHALTLARAGVSVPFTRFTAEQALAAENGAVPAEPLAPIRVADVLSVPGAPLVLGLTRFYGCPGNPTVVDVRDLGSAGYTLVVRGLDEPSLHRGGGCAAAGILIVIRLDGVPTPDTPPQVATVRAQGAECALPH
jgi:hypothetical protein